MQVRCCYLARSIDIANNWAGTGCIAALEAEKWLAEQESPDGETGPEQDSEIRKGKPQTNGDVPEYRSNPLL